MSPVWDPARGFDRRQFLKLVGGGIAVLVTAGPAELFAQEQRRMYPEDLNAYLRIGADGRVTVSPTQPVGTRRPHGRCRH